MPGPLRVRKSLVALLVGVVLVGAVVGYRHSLRVEAENAGPWVENPLVFRHEDLDHEVLDKLRLEKGLDEVVGQGSRIERLVRLCHWTSEQFENGTRFPDPYPPWNAILILAQIEAGQTTGFCAQKAQVFAQACSSFGWRSRYIELGPHDHPVAHYSTEVWVPEVAGWVHLDPFLDVRFEVDGRLGSALDVHRALVDGRSDRIVVRRGLDGLPVEGDERRRMIETFYYLRYHLKMDHLSDPSRPFEREDMVDWNDPQTIPWEDSEAPVPGGIEHLPTARHDVFDAETFDFAVDRVRVDVAADRFAGTATLGLAHCMPGFDHYDVAIDGEHRTEGPIESLIVDVGEGGTTVEITPVNRRGARGLTARLRLSWWP